LQYIEDRFNPWLRRYVSLLFVLQMTFYSAVSLYLPSLPLYTTLKIPQELSVGLIGLVCIVYSSVGGLKAVTWTNLYHSILLLFTMVTIIVVGTYKSGGLATVVQVSYDAGRFSLGQDYLQLDLTTRHTIFNTLAGYTLVRLFLHGTSQMQVQSALSLSSMRKSQLSQLLSAIFYLIIQIVASAIGLVLLVNYKDCDPYLNGEISRQDELLMHYLHKSLGSIPLLQGMFIAAIFGSTLTTMSSYLSSTSSMLVEDFVRPVHSFIWGTGQQKKLTDGASAQIGKLTSILLGLLCVLLTFEMSKISGLQQATTTMYGVIGMPILSAFILGTCTKFVNGPGMFAGMLASMSFGVYVFVAHLTDRPHLEPSLPISMAGCSQQTIDHWHQSNSSANVLMSLFGDDDDDDIFEGQESLVEPKQVHLEPVEPFKLSHMSYLWLPFFTMVISVTVASLVSVCTGGLNQTVDERYLAPKLKGGKLAAKTKDRLKSLMSVAGGCSSYDSIEIKLKQDDNVKTTNMTFSNLGGSKWCLDEPFGGASPSKPDAARPNNYHL
jgi:SSS family transporter